VTRLAPVWSTYLASDVRGTVTPLAIDVSFGSAHFAAETALASANRALDAGYIIYIEGKVRPR
jgi:hypothetical protein